MATIALTDPNSKTSLAVARSLSRHGHKVLLVGQKLSRVGVSRHVSPLGSASTIEPHRIENLAERLHQRGADVLLPIGGQSTWVLSQYRSKVLPTIRLQLADEASISIALDKTRTRNQAQSVGVRTPRSFTPSEAAEQLRFNDGSKVVVKSPHELAKVPPIYARTTSELFSAIDTQEQKTGLSPMLTEYIEGDGVGFCALYRRGILVDFYMHRRLRETPMTGGASTFAETIFLRDVAQSGKALLDSLAWHGIAMVEFKIAESGPVLLEVNPKFWGSYNLGQYVGVDFAQQIVEWEATHVDVDIQEKKLEPTYPVGAQFSWLLDGDVRALLKSDSTFFGLVRAVGSRDIGVDISLTDPVPDLFKVCGGGFLYLLSWIGLRKVFLRSLRTGMWGSLRRAFAELTGVPLARGFDVSGVISIGPQPSRVGIWVLQRRGFTHVLSVRESMPRCLKRGFGRRLTLLHIPMREHAEVPEESLRRAASQIAEVVENGGRVYVHCREGVGRAPMAVASYFIIFHRMEVEAALGLCARKRPDVALNPRQVKALEAASGFGL